MVRRFAQSSPLPDAFTRAGRVAGLSYATHKFSDLKVSGRTVSFKLSRSGDSGCETPQVYLGFPGAASDAKVPVKVLRYWKKTCDSAEDFSYDVADADVSNWDVKAQAWQVTRGTYIVYVGASSQDVRLTGKLVV